MQVWIVKNLFDTWFETADMDSPKRVFLGHASRQLNFNKPFDYDGVSPIYENEAVLYQILEIHHENGECSKIRQKFFAPLHCLSLVDYDNSDYLP